MALAAENIVSFPQKTIDGFIARLYKNHNLSIDDKMWKQTFAEFDRAIGKGFGKVEFDTPDWMLNQNLRYNAASFAAFKNHSEIKEIQALLLDGDRIRKWEDFRDKALLISGKYNKRWLQTEYNHATQSARMARKWQDATADADLYPNLQYVAVMDERTRHSHAELHGAIYPINDPFWDSHYPPNGWGCRCTIRPTDKPTKKEVSRPIIPDGFDNNPGKSGMVFSKGQNFFTNAGRAEKAFLNNVVGKTIQPPQVVKESYKKYQAYSTKWKKEYFNFDNAGYYVSHKGHRFDVLTGNFEKETAKVLANNSYQVELLNELTGKKQFDTMFLGFKADIKTVFSEKKIVKRAGDAVAQGAECVIYYLTKDIPKSYLYKRFRSVYDTHKEIREIYYVYNGGLHSYKK